MYTYRLHEYYNQLPFAKIDCGAYHFGKWTIYDAV